MYETAVSIIGVGIVFFLGILATHIDKEHSLLKMFLLIFGMWFSVGLLNIAQLIITDNSGIAGAYTSFVALYWGMMSVSFFTTFYFILYYLKLFLQTIKNNKENERFRLD